MSNRRNPNNTRPLKMAAIKIRQSTPSDCAVILRFIRELAEYEKALPEAVATESDLQAALFGSNPNAFALICTIDEAPVGFALYFFNFSTWLGKNGLFLEDLYVSPKYRGSGAGKALLKHLAKIAVDQQCGRFEWNVLDWNTPAIDFYESFGAEPLHEWVGYRLTGKALKRFAS